MSQDTLIVIPARLSSQRLPNKPLADIGGEAMIVHVWRRAMEAECGRVVVAAGEPQIVDVIVQAGGQAVLTDPDLPSGSDRIYQALVQIDPHEKIQRIINMQGDLPTLDPILIRRVAEILTNAEIATLVAKIKDDAERVNPNVVKAVIAFDDAMCKAGRALYFTRASAPYGEGSLYHHIGIYGFWRTSLQKFVGLSPTPLEQREKLEQLRALESGMEIRIACVDTVPIGVDTPEDLELARAQILKGNYKCRTARSK